MAEKKIVVDLNLNNNKIKNLANPTNNSDAATKEYVDAAVSSGGGGSSGDILKTVILLDPKDSGNTFIIKRKDPTKTPILVWYSYISDDTSYLEDSWYSQFTETEFSLTNTTDFQFMLNV